MISFNEACERMELFFKAEGRTILLAGETENAWIFRGSFLGDDDVNTAVIFDKSTEEKHFAHPILDHDILKNAVILIDNR